MGERPAEAEVAMSTHDPTRRGGWSFREHLTPVGPLDLVTHVGTPVEGPPLELHQVFTEDGLYLPVVVRTPEGPGPHPTVVCLHGGSGGLGVPWLVDFVQNRGVVMERLLDAGYAVAFTEGRREIEGAYGTEPRGVLDHEDVQTAYEYLRRQDAVDEDRIGFFGVSHGGELQLKLATALAGDQPPAALVPFEPAVIEYLGLRFEGPRTEESLQFRDDLDDDHVDLARARDRIDRIPDDLPILLGGRDDDHLQGLFRKCHELLSRAGKRVEWVSWDHPEHAYQWGPRRTETVDFYAGSNVETSREYRLDELQSETLDRVVSFLDEHVGGAR